MSEENQQVAETGVETTEENNVKSPDIGALIAENKKYRTRAQSSEAENANLRKQIEDSANATLKENEEWKAYAEKTETKLNEALPYKAKFEALYENRRQKALSKFTEEQQEQYKDKDPEWLESLAEAQGKNNFTEPSDRASVPQNEEFGGYSSNMEWVTKDPKGYEESRNKSKGDKFGNVFSSVR